MTRKGSLGTDHLRPSKVGASIKKTMAPKNGQAVGATIKKSTGKRTDSRWPDAPSKPGKRAKAPRGVKLTIAEKVGVDEPKVTGNNIAGKIKFRNQ